MGEESSEMESPAGSYIIVDTPGKIKTLKTLKFTIIFLVVALFTYALIY